MVRNTHQKEVVLRTILAMPGHQPADAVYEQVRKEIPTVGRATVYRILNQLAEQGTVRKLQTFEGADIFDKRTDKHYHIQCQCCGGVADLDVPAVEGLLDKVPADSGYTVRDYEIVFYGTCPHCKQAAS